MYNINYKIIKKNIGFYRVFFIIGIFILIAEICMFGVENIISPLLIFMILPFSFIIVGLKNMSKEIKRLKQVEELNRKAVLYKNVPYVLERTNMKVNNVRLRKPVINFQLPGGISIRLEGDPRHDTAQIPREGLIDVLIDPNDTSNHYIDFNIDRLDGNRPEDYYKSINEQPKVEQQIYNQPQENKTVNYFGKPL